MVKALDLQVGDIVARLKKHGIYEDTLIMFTSDNGPPNTPVATEAGHPAHFDSGFKCQGLEGGRSFCCPLAKHIKQSRSTAALLSTTDDGNAVRSPRQRHTVDQGLDSFAFGPMY